MGTLVDNYIFKALDAYPYDLEDTIEALNYALAYDEKNTIALTLLGRVYAEVLKDYERAKGYYEEALAENMHDFEVYPHYINVLLWNEDFKEAEKLIDFAITLKGANKAILYQKKANLYERLKVYKKALEFLKMAKEYNYDSEFIDTLNIEKERITGKMPKKKKKKSNRKIKK